LPFWLSHFEHCLAVSTDNGATYFFGRLTYVDVAVFHALNSSEAQFPEEYAALSIPLLKAFQIRMRELPAISSYLASGRVRPWAGDSMM